MQLKILTANVAMGNPDADKLIPCIKSLLWFHNWRVVPFLIFGGRFGRIFDYGSHSRAGRPEWFLAHSSLSKVIDLITAELPDVIILNELLYQIHYETLNTALAELGYKDIVWGFSPHHPDAILSTVVASRIPVLSGGASLELPWGRQIGGGGGASYVSLADMPVTVVGCHLVIGKGMRVVFEKEIAVLKNFAEEERKSGRQVVIAGDFNATDGKIQDTMNFASLKLKTVTTQKTNPLCLPAFLRTECDHIFLPSNWQIPETRFLSFGSDHLAVVTEVKTTSTAE
jgi:endonuclease/exonuclease/phosphatase (EEP) superfamily protein YafD